MSLSSERGQGDQSDVAIGRALHPYPLPEPEQPQTGRGERGRAERQRRAVIEQQRPVMLALVEGGDRALHRQLPVGSGVSAPAMAAVRGPTLRTNASAKSSRVSTSWRRLGQSPASSTAPLAA